MKLCFVKCIILKKQKTCNSFYNVIFILGLFLVSGDGTINLTRKRDPDFCLHLSVSRNPIILLGVGLFLPYGENIKGSLRLVGNRHMYKLE